MGMRFRKSFGGKGFRVNVSKSGVGFSAGGKGYRYTKKAGGGSRTTASIPGTGISYVKDSSGKKRKAAASSAVSAVPANSPNYLLFWILWRIISVIMIPMGLLLAFVYPVFGLICAAIGIAEWFAASHYKKLHKETKEGA